MRGTSAGVDYVGLGLISLGLGCLQFVLDRGQQQDWLHSPAIVVGFLLAGGCLVAFVVWEWHTEHPIIDVRMFRDRTFAAGSALMLVTGFLLFAPLVLLPAFEQYLMGYSPQQAGQTMSPGAISLMLLTPLVGVLVARVDARKLVAVGALLLAGAQVYMASRLHVGVDFQTLLVLRIYQVAGLAFLFVPINTLVYASVAKEKNNAVAAILNLGRNLGGSIGIAFVTTMIARQSQVHQTALVSHTTGYDSAFTAQLARLTRALEQGGASTVEAGRKARALTYQEVQRQATQLAYLDTLRLLAIAAGLMLPLLLLARGNRATPGETMKKTYQGSCHCKAVRFSCQLDLAPAGQRSTPELPGIRWTSTFKCNCSSCWKNRFWKGFVRAQDFRLEAGSWPWPTTSLPASRSTTGSAAAAGRRCSATPRSSRWAARSTPSTSAAWTTSPTRSWPAPPSPTRTAATTPGTGRPPSPPSCENSWDLPMNPGRVRASRSPFLYLALVGALVAPMPGCGRIGYQPMARVAGGDAGPTTDTPPLGMDATDLLPGDQRPPDTADAPVVSPTGSDGTATCLDDPTRGDLLAHFETGTATMVVVDGRGGDDFTLVQSGAGRSASSPIRCKVSVAARRSWHSPGWPSPPAARATSRPGPSAARWGPTVTWTRGRSAACGCRCDRHARSW